MAKRISDATWLSGKIRDPPSPPARVKMKMTPMLRGSPTQKLMFSMDIIMDDEKSRITGFSFVLFIVLQRTGSSRWLKE